ncbi:MAG: YceI family protein [Candidatus Baltobacteraceae bacterium]
MHSIRSKCAAVTLLMFLASASVALADTTVTRQIDPGKSTATFTVQHIFVQHVSGTVPISSGTVVLTLGSLVPLDVSARLNPRAVHTDAPDRDKALRGAEFFDVRRYPTWRFRSTKILAKGPKAFTMDGDLTIHGVTQPERLNVTISGSAADPIYHATCTIDRHAFGMAVTRLDPVIGGTVEVALDIVLQ